MVLLIRQNCRIWDDHEPQEVHLQAMHPQKVTVWCGFWSGGIFGAYFFENDMGEAITINGECYRSMIDNFLWLELNDMDVRDMWFLHTVNDTMNILHERFRGRVISRKGDVNWLPRSCDLTPLDFFLWGFLKSQVYANKPQSIVALKANITQAIAQIQPDSVQQSH
ncbi:hypothetical protein KR009_005943 [Drosophila setifemur]|nr:hypothetical protein KR009_005943 [Drosophila setifemur]